MLRASEKTVPVAQGEATRPVEGLERVSTVEALVRALRSRILQKDFSAGTPLREVELAESYEVARYTVRVALQRLQHEGLATHQANRGVFVPEMTDDDIIDLYAFRSALECEAARRVVIGQTPLDGVKDALRWLEGLPSDSAWSDVMQADLGIHRALVDAAGSRRMTSTFDSLVNQLLLCLAQINHLYPLRPIVADHEGLVRVLTSERDPQRAADRVRQHLEIALDEVLTGRPPAGDTER